MFWLDILIYVGDELLPTPESWSIYVKVWMKDLCTVPNVYDVEVSQPIIRNTMPADSMTLELHRLDARRF